MSDTEPHPQLGPRPRRVWPNSPPPNLKVGRPLVCRRLGRSVVLLQAYPGGLVNVVRACDDAEAHQVAREWAAFLGSWHGPEQQR